MKAKHYCVQCGMHNLRDSRWCDVCYVKINKTMAHIKRIKNQGYKEDVTLDAFLQKLTDSLKDKYDLYLGEKLPENA